MEKFQNFSNSQKTFVLQGRGGILIFYGFSYFLKEKKLNFCPKLYGFLLDFVVVDILKIMPLSTQIIHLKSVKLYKRLYKERKRLYKEPEQGSSVVKYLLFFGGLHIQCQGCNKQHGIGQILIIHKFYSVGRFL